MLNLEAILRDFINLNDFIDLKREILFCEWELSYKMEKEVVVVGSAVIVFKV